MKRTDPFDPRAPYNGRPLTPAGMDRAVTTRLRQTALDALVDDYRRTQSAAAAAHAAGTTRRLAATVLARLGLVARPRRIQAGPLTVYPDAATEAAGEHVVRTRYPWGVVHRAVTLYTRDGLSSTATARALGLDAATVATWMRALGCLRAPGVSRRVTWARETLGTTPEAIRAEVCHLRREGHTVADVARLTGVPRVHVSRMLDAAGMPPRRQAPRRSAYRSGGGCDRAAVAARRAEVQRLRATARVPDIAAALGVSVQTVYLDLRALAALTPATP